MENSKCKICRRVGVKLFLKGDKCLSPKCPILKRPYPPGQKRKRRGRSRGLSEYGEELKEKQKLKNWYNLTEAQFRNYVRGILAKRGKVEDAAALLIKELESRLDNVVFRLGFAKSRSQARQLVSHGHFLVNNKKIDVPGHRVKKEDVIKVSAQASKNTHFKNLPHILKKYTPPSWLSLDIDKLEGKVKGEPELQEAESPAEISTIFEHYSR